MATYTVITGEMAVMLDVLGHRMGDSRILKAIALVGPTMDIHEFDFGGEKSTHFTFNSSGADMIFEDGVLVAAMVRTQPAGGEEPCGEEPRGVYPRPAALVQGLSPTATRAEVAAFLGSPEREGPGFDRYEVNGRYLHFEFDSNSRAARLTALLEPV